jgi:hypothetical protein
MSLEYAQTLVDESIEQHCTGFKTIISPDVKDPVPLSPAPTSGSRHLPVPLCPFATLTAVPLKVLRDSSGCILGDVGLRPGRNEGAMETKDLPRQEQIWSLGYVLAESMRGRGVAKEMAAGVVEFANVWMGTGGIRAVSGVSVVHIDSRRNGVSH